jgi:hypothetical protein
MANLKDVVSRSGRLLGALTVLGFLSLQSCDSGSKTDTDNVIVDVSSNPNAITISADFPSDIPGGATNASLGNAARYAWNEFIALNWPAVAQNGAAGVRDTPDTNAKFGTQSGPLVWHTFRSKVEIYPWTNHLPNGSSVDTVFNPDTTIKSFKTVFNYDALPEYFYQDEVLPCVDPPSASVAWVNLDETSEIGLNNMFAGSNPSAPTSDNVAPQLIRFLAKANRTHFDYVTENSFYNHGANYNQYLSNYINAVNRDSVNDTTVISFPVGTMMAKSAWRLLGPNDTLNQYHTTTVRYYEEGTGGEACYYQVQTWGMIALHIIHKTPTAPAYIFASFEQKDNLRSASGEPLENAGGKIINQPPASESATSPPIVHEDSPTSTTTTATGPFCDDNDQRLYYKNLSPGLPKSVSGDSGVCVNYRFEAIPDTIIAVNQEAQNLIRAYNTTNNISNSPWEYYTLVNVQSQPFNKTDITSANPSAQFNRSTFSMANSVVETNYTLGQFAGRLIATGAETGQTSNFNPRGSTANNVHLRAGSVYTSFNMGGCMGCHGNAQLQGTDFSFILNFGPVMEPDVPPSPGSLDALMRKYKF